jgi:hypothetical protein
MVSKAKNNPTIMEGLTVLVVVVASLKFLFQGGSVTLFGTADASVYAMFLAPVLGTHGYIRTKAAPKQKVDNPDGK